MRFLFTSDIHLSARPRDEYRWSIFPWLRMNAENRSADAIFLLGDITDQKDNHGNAFINRIVDAVRDLETVAPVYALKGNHDYSDPAAPLLRFLPNFATQPMPVEVGGARLILYPNAKFAPKEGEWGRMLKAYPPGDYDFALCHQTFSGAKSENGMTMTGIHADALEGAKFAVSGDIHVPQRVGCVRYCGAPHPIRFGDSFQPRVLFFDGEQLKSLPRTTIKKAVVQASSVEEVAAAELTEGDQVKVRLTLARSEFGGWDEVRAEIRSLAASRGWDLCGVELQEAGDTARVRLKGAAPASGQVPPQRILRAFCKANDVPAALAEVGMGLLEAR